MQSFADRLAASARRAGSWLCVGLDPDPAAYPAGLKAEDTPEFLEGALSAVAPVAAAVKPNAAFFEALGEEGHGYQEDVIDWAQSKGLVVILDGKRGDIGNTAEKYAQAAFDVLGVDAVTVNPYMGVEAIEPFARHPGKGVFVLTRTSNPSAADFQDIRDANGAHLWERVAKQSMAWNKTWRNVGLVAGATHPGELSRVRQIAGDGVPILIPGVGAQGGDARSSLKQGADSNGRFALVNVGRAILNAGKGADWREQVAASARRFAVELAAP